jgi:PKD repeat protein
LYRLDFGNSLENTPTHTDLGNPGSLLSQPYQTKFLKFNDTWYAFAVNFANSRLLRFTFGNGVNMAPTSTTDLGNFGLLNKPMGLFINEEGGNYIVTVSNNSGNDLTLINFGNSPANNPTTSDAISFGSDIGLNGSGRLSIIKTSTNWYGLVCSVNNGKVYKLDFESILFDTNYSFAEVASVSTPNGVELIREGLNYVGYVVSNTNGFYRLSFGQNISNSPAVETIGKIGIPDQFRSLKIVRQSPGWFGFINSRNGSLLSKVSFSDNCSGSLAASNAFEPHGVSYRNAGNFAIELTAFSTNGNFDTYMDTVVIRDASSPAISFTTENACIDNENSFAASSSNDASVTSWNWNFGDGIGTASGQNVNYQFLNTGDYIIQLDISTTDGCSNTTSDSIRIAQVPVASFNLPISNLCTNSSLSFTNTSNSLAEDSAIFIWNYNNEALDTITHGSYIFDSNGIKDISLYVNLTGCQDTLSQQITLSPGPFVDFNWSNNCFGDSLHINNTSDVTNTTFSWDFGDGSPGSSLSEPKHLYSAASNYAISLTVSDTTIGCISIKTDSIYVNDQSLANFSHDSLIIENIPTQFYGQDLTLKGDSIVHWNWDFNSLGSSTFMNPIITFSQSDSIVVILSVVTEQGCGAQYSDTIVVQEPDKPLSSFFMPDSTCIGSEINLSNTTINGSNYQWDFCMDDLSVDPVFESSYTITGGNLPIDTDIIFEQGVWYGFSCDFLNNKLYRLDFGNSLENTPTHTDLGNPGNLLSQPYQTKFLKFNDTWYAFAVNFANSRLLRFTFGNGVNMAPTSTTDLGNFGLLNKPMGLFINEEGGNYIVTVSNNSGNDLTLINFGNSPANNPTTSDAISFGSDIGLNGSGRLSIIKTSTNWYGLVCSVNNGKVYKLDFESILFDTNYSFAEVASVSTPNGVELIREGLNYVGYVVSNTNGFYRLSFGQNISNSPAVETIGKIGIPDQFRSLKIVRQSPGWFGFINSRNGSLLSKVSFSDNCSGSLAASNAFEPHGVSYRNAGNFAIELTAFSTNGNFDTYMDTVVIRDASSPAITFTTENACLANENLFTASSSDDASITSWSWDFGDGVGTASGQNVGYQFLSTGSYRVRLSIDATNGCSNSSRQLLAIYDPPQPGFDHSSGLMCSNTPLDFTNGTIFSGPDSILSYQWNMDDDDLLYEVSPSYTFTSGGDKNVTLQASIPGCSSVFSQVIDITPGPMTSFSHADSCVYVDFEFINQSTGDEISGYQWDFGDGYTSSMASPTHQYESGGTYAVALTTSNMLGCHTTLQKVVQVYFTPTSNFTNDLACSDNSATFYDQSTVNNANISEQYWRLSNNVLGYEEQGTGPSPTFALGGEGNYALELIAISNYGCSDTLVRNDVLVKPSPVANIIYENTCFGDTTILTEAVDLPEETEMSAIDWFIDGKLYSSNEVKYKFPEPDDYTIEMYVRANNFCTDNISEVISIAPLPEVDILLSSFCAAHLVTVSPVVNSPLDPVISYHWQINDKSVSNGESFAYQFSKPEDYGISVAVSTENNCSASAMNTFAIHPSPVSEFEIFPSIGASPLNVAFTDRSDGATDIKYDFSVNNDDMSNEANPSYNYVDLGKDWPRQIAENEFGCTDTSFAQIEVVIPVYDIAMTNVDVAATDQKLKMKVELANNGTIIINNPKVQIDVDEKVSLNHQLSGRLMPGDIRAFEVDFEVFTKNKNLNYICFTAQKELGSYVDINPYDNAECVSIESLFTVMDPYPNPSRDYIFVPIVLPASDNCELTISSEKGEIVFRREYRNMAEGLNLFRVDLATYSKGLYLLNIRYQEAETTKKIVIQ